MQVEFKQDKQLKEDQLIIKAKKLTPEIGPGLFGRKTGPEDHGLSRQR